jgi:DNA processing protein
MLTFPEEAYWLALSHNYTDTNLFPLLNVHERFGSLSPLWEGSVDLTHYGLDRRSIAEVDRIKRYTRLEDYLSMKKHLDERGIKLLKYSDEAYPSQLKRLSSQREGPPIVLYHSGTLSTFERCVSMVGTRVLSQYGHSCARTLARDLAKEGYAVVSGLALGTDTDAHVGALQAPRGKTIAVTAWMEPMYPLENRTLAMDIMRRGCIVSEFLQFSFGGKVAKSAFVRRNRITSGLSPCLVVIESDEKGGTVHQVNFAISQGKKIFVLEPRAGNAMARRGYELFLKMGATPFKTATPILDYLKSGDADWSIRHFISSQHDLRKHLVS